MSQVKCICRCFFHRKIYFWRVPTFHQNFGGFLLEVNFFLASTTKKSCDRWNVTSFLFSVHFRFFGHQLPYRQLPFHISRYQSSLYGKNKTYPKKKKKIQRNQITASWQATGISISADYSIFKNSALWEKWSLLRETKYHHLQFLKTFVA